MRIAAVLLAAGAAQRFGGPSKLLADLGGMPLIVHAACTLAASSVAHIVVVTGREAAAIEAALPCPWPAEKPQMTPDSSDGNPPPRQGEGDQLHSEHNQTFDFVHNPGWSEGLGGSVAAGVRALPENVDGVLIIPADMPFLTPAILSAMIERFESAPEPRPIVFAQSPDGTQTNPVLWPKRFFAELASLTGAAGAKLLIKRYAAEAQAFPVTDARLMLDIDTREDLERARQGFAGS